MLPLELCKFFFSSCQIRFGSSSVLFGRHVVKDDDITFLQVKAVQVIERIFCLLSVNTRE